MISTPYNSTTPTQYSCRSQLYRKHLDSGARFEPFADTIAVAEYAGTGDEAGQAVRLALADLSTLPRTGFKGAGAPGWLEEQGAQVPESPNQSVRQKDGGVIARLSMEEFLILNSLIPDSTLAIRLQDRRRFESAKEVYVLPRRDSHCWLALTGTYAGTTLAKICAVDLRLHKFAELEVAQTLIARVNALILRVDLGTTPCFFILCDVSVTEYLWDTMLDAMAEFQGMPVGIMALRSLESGMKNSQTGNNSVVADTGGDKPGNLEI
ncbi:MAG: sarcosine oxidase [Gammaproteobacteria bacterium]